MADKIFTASEFVNKLKDVANNYKTLYVIGCFGAPMTEKNKKRYINNGSHNGYNARPERAAKINAASSDTFGFDCVNLPKGLFWGWNGDKNAVYGGAQYASNGVPDFGADAIGKYCTDFSADFSNIVPGEALWMDGHVGIYIGDGFAVECTPIWDDKVQITNVGNVRSSKAGYHTRKWKKHGKLIWIDYKEEKEVTKAEVQAMIDASAAEILKQTQKMIDASKEKVYNYWNQLPDWAYAPMMALYKNGYFSGRSTTDLDLNETLMRASVELANALKKQGIINY